MAVSVLLTNPGHQGRLGQGRWTTEVGEDGPDQEKPAEECGQAAEGCPPHGWVGDVVHSDAEGTDGEAEEKQGWPDDVMIRVSEPATWCLREVPVQAARGQPRRWLTVMPRSAGLGLCDGRPRRATARAPGSPCRARSVGRAHRFILAMAADGRRRSGGSSTVRPGTMVGIRTDRDGRETSSCGVGAGRCQPVRAEGIRPQGVVRLRLLRTLGSAQKPSRAMLAKRE